MLDFRCTVQELATKATERCMELEEQLTRANAELKERNRQIESLSEQVRWLALTPGNHGLQC